MRELTRHTIFVTLAGSHAHGTARAGSDLDLRGVCIAPPATRLSLFERFEQHEGPLDAELAALLGPRLPTGPVSKTECVIYDVAKLLALCAAANPNTLELLFADPTDWLLDTPAWQRIHAERRTFLTRKVQQTYLGYALAQLQKIQTHRGWLTHPPARKPSRADFGLPESSTLPADDRDRIERGIAEKLRAWGIDDLEMPKDLRIALQERVRALWSDLLASSSIDERMRDVAIQSVGLPPAVVAALEGERRYRAAMKHWESFARWQHDRNPARADLERRFGYDTKHAMHLVRLMRMGLEVLRTGELHVRRADAEELLAIRDGALSFDRLLEAAADLQAQISEAPAHPSLPPDVDHARVDALLLELVRG